MPDAIICLDPDAFLVDPVIVIVVFGCYALCGVTQQVLDNFPYLTGLTSPILGPFGILTNAKPR